MNRNAIVQSNRHIRQVGMPALSLDQGRFLLFALLDCEAPMHAVGRKGVAALAAEKAKEARRKLLVLCEDGGEPSCFDGAFEECRELRARADALDLISIGLRKRLL